MPSAGRWRELINTDNAVYGGSGVGNGELATEAVAAHDRGQSVVLNLPPLACLVLTPMCP